MALSVLLGVVGLLELLAPKRLVDFWFRLATDGDAELRPWVYAAARVEGAMILLWLVARKRRGRSGTQ